MPTLEDNIIGRLSTIEFIVAQCLAMSLVSVHDKDAFIADAKKMFFVRANRLPPEAVPSALDSADRIFSSALRSAKGIADEV